MLSFAWELQTGADEEVSCDLIHFFAYIYEYMDMVLDEISTITLDRLNATVVLVSFFQKKKCVLIFVKEIEQ